MDKPLTRSVEQARAWSVAGELREFGDGQLILVIGARETPLRRIDVDRAGRALFGDRRRRLDAVAFAGAHEACTSAQAIHMAAMASIDPASDPHLLTFLRALVGERLPTSPAGMPVAFSTAQPLFAWDGGLELSPPGLSLSEGGPWRSGVREAVQTVGSQIVVRNADCFLLLDEDLSMVWSALSGTSDEELARILKMDATRVRRAVDTLRDQGLVSANAQWRVRGDAVWTSSDDESLYLARVGRLDPPVVVGGWGAVIWRIVSGSPLIATSEIVRRIEAETETPHDITADVEAFLFDLCARGFIQC